MGKRSDLAGGQMPPGAGRQAGELNAADFDAHELGDRMAERGHHAAHLPVAAFVNGQLDIGLPAGAVGACLAPQQPDILGRPGQAVVEHDAPAQALQSVFGRDAGDGNAVRFRDMVARVGQLEQKIPVIREEDQPLAVGIQPPDRPQHRLAADVHQIRDHLPGVAVRVGARRDYSLRLVHREVVALQRRPHDPVVEQNLIGFRVGFRAKLGHGQSVNFDPALGDPRFARPPRADPGGGEHFLQPFFHTV